MSISAPAVAWCLSNVSGPFGKARRRSGHTAPIVDAPKGGPRAGWTPASQRSNLLGPARGESVMRFPAGRDGFGAGAPGPGGSLLGSHPDEQ